MERRGRIPVATFRTPEGKTRSRSRVRDPKYNKSDPDTDLFTLLEDNIAMKEENETLSNKYNACTKEKETLEKENAGLKTQIKDLQSQQGSLKSQIVDLNHKLNLVTEEKMSIKSLQNENIQKVKALSAQLEELRRAQKDYLHIIEMNKKFKEQIDKLIPAATTNEFESLIDTPKDASNFIAIECIEKVLTEFSMLKANLNVAELQLYEANEKVSELIENQNHLEREIESLREENTNLTRVAELMTKNMKESMTTTKKMEDAFLLMKRRNEDLQKRNMDSLDSPINKRDSAPNEEIIRLREEITKRDLAHGERIVEMKKLIDTIENSNNDELKTLRLRLELLEVDLKDAIERAERAEADLDDIRKSVTTCRDGIANENSNNSDNINNNVDNSPTDNSMLVATCQSCKCKLSANNGDAVAVRVESTLPPPPPPPLPNFNFPPSITNTTNSIKGSNSSLNESISSYNLKSGVGGGGVGGASNTTGTSENLFRKQQVKATGLDALVRELKDGNVTLRRARRKTRTNQALQEMFDVLETSRTQNRNSKLFIESHISSINIPSTDF